MHTTLASIEENASRLDSEVEDPKAKSKQLGSTVNELKESIQFNEEDIPDLKTRSAVSDDDGHVFWSWTVLCYLLPFFVCLNNLVSCVGVFIWKCQRKERSKTWMTIVLNRFALLLLENTIGTISPFLFAINHRKSRSKRHLKILSCPILTGVHVCVRACVSVRVLMNNKVILE